MQVHKVEKKLRLTKKDAVKYQLLTELVFLRKEQVIPSDMDILTLLAMWGPLELSKFCNEAAKELYVIEKMEDFSIRAQNVRNRMSKLQKRGFVVKDPEDKKVVKLASDIPVESTGNVLLDYKFLGLM